MQDIDSRVFRVEDSGSRTIPHFMQNIDFTLDSFPLVVCKTAVSGCVCT